MKTITIYERRILERTGFQKYLYREANQVSIFYDGKEYKNHLESIDNPRLKVKFQVTLKTRSKADLKAFVDKLGRTDAEKWIKSTIETILTKEGK